MKFTSRFPWLVLLFIAVVLFAAFLFAARREYSCYSQGACLVVDRWTGNITARWAELEPNPNEAVIDRLRQRADSLERALIALREAEPDCRAERLLAIAERCPPAEPESASSPVP